MISPNDNIKPGKLYVLLHSLAVWADGRGAILPAGECCVVLKIDKAQHPDPTVVRVTVLTAAGGVAEVGLTNGTVPYWFEEAQKHDITGQH